MNSNYVADVQETLYPERATCCRATCCPGVNAALGGHMRITSTINNNSDTWRAIVSLPCCCMRSQKCERSLLCDGIMINPNNAPVPFIPCAAYLPCCDVLQPRMRVPCIH